MRHSVHIMLGRAFKESVLELKKYILKYGGAEVPSYFNALLMNQESNGNLEISTVNASHSDSDEFVSGVNDSYSVMLDTLIIIQEKERIFRLKSFFNNLYSNTITINNQGDYSELHVCIYLPLYDKVFWSQCKELIECMNSLNKKIHIDIVGIACDMVDIFVETEEEREKLPLLWNDYVKNVSTIIHEVVNFKKQNSGVISHFIVLQNSQSFGISLALDFKSFIRIIGEFTLLCVECYQNLFGAREIGSDLQGIGISVLNFDKHYFVEYLLRKTYLYAMDREGINDTEVDVVMATNKTDSLLKDKIHFFNDFYAEEIKSRLNQNQSQESIIAEITPLLKRRVETIKTDLEAFISDETLSIPAKRAILANLLGLDDDFFVNQSFSKKQLISEDLEQEAITIFIQANNALLDTKHCDKASLSVNNMPVEYSLPKIKELRINMRRRSEYIRQLQNELEATRWQINKRKEAEKYLIKDGYFTINNNHYKLIDDISEDIALEESYTSHPVTLSSIDLREDFPPIKDQKELGACLAFSLTSVYEFLLRVNSNDQSDLSEAFLYYTARKLKGESSKDKGLNLNCAIEALSKYGICTEDKCQYDPKKYKEDPSPEAYNDAEKRKIKKALNVNVNIDEIKSALEDGYPVIASFKIFDSFGAGYKGFISAPQGEERKSFGYHAMVICGYSENEKVFIVRNSWGRGFGDKGYCYFPYTYIVDNNLVNWACIITEIQMQTIQPRIKKTQLHFDESDTGIRYSILRTQIEVEKFFLELDCIKNKQLSEEYLRLKQNLRSPDTRDSIIEGTELRLKEEQQQSLNHQKEASENKNNELKAFTRRTFINTAYIGLFALMSFTLLGLLIYFTDFVTIFKQTPSWVILIGAFLLISSLFMYFPYRKKKKEKLKDELDDIIIHYGICAEDKQKEINELHIKMHIGGMILRGLFDLQDKLMTKHKIIKSFVENLSVWYQEELETQSMMNAEIKPPFISLLNNRVLDKYFEINKNQIVENIRLYTFIEDYQVSENAIRTFKNNLKRSIISNIKELYKDFSIYSHITAKTSYSFLDTNHTDIKKLLPELDTKSDIFLECQTSNGALNPQKSIYIHTLNDYERREWDNKYGDSFSVKPLSYGLTSPYKIMIVNLADLNINQVKIANL